MGSAWTERWLWRLPLWCLGPATFPSGMPSPATLTPRPLKFSQICFLPLQCTYISPVSNVNSTSSFGTLRELKVSEKYKNSNISFKKEQLLWKLKF